MAKKKEFKVTRSAEVRLVAESTPERLTDQVTAALNELGRADVSLAYAPDSQQYVALVACQPYLEWPEVL